MGRKRSAPTGTPLTELKQDASQRWQQRCGLLLMPALAIGAVLPGRMIRLLGAAPEEISAKQMSRRKSGVKRLKSAARRPPQIAPQMS